MVINIRITTFGDVKPCSFAVEEPATMRMVAIGDHSVDIVCGILGSLSSRYEQLCLVGYKSNRLCGNVDRRCGIVSLCSATTQHTCVYFRLQQPDDEEMMNLAQDFADDSYLMVSQLHWEDEVVWNGDDIKHKVISVY
jgi:hypothetical protein